MFIRSVEPDDPMEGYKLECLKHSGQPLLSIVFQSRTNECKEGYSAGAKHDVSALCLRCVVELFKKWSCYNEAAISNQGVRKFCRRHHFIGTTGVKESHLFQIVKYIEWSFCEDDWFCERCIHEEMRKLGLIEPLWREYNYSVCPRQCGKIYDTRLDKFIQPSEDLDTSRYIHGVISPMVLCTSQYCPDCFMSGLKKTIGSLKMVYAAKSK